MMIFQVFVFYEDFSEGQRGAGRHAAVFAR